MRGRGLAGTVRSVTMHPVGPGRIAPSAQPGRDGGPAPGSLAAGPPANVPVRRAPRLGLVVALYYLITLVGAGLLLVVQPALGLDPVIIELVQFGPTLGVIAVLLVWRRRWRPPLLTGLTRRPGWRAPVATLAAIAMIFGLILTTYAVLGRDVRYTGPTSIAQPFWLIGLAQLVGACGEEFGWRSFLQPYLRTRFGVASTGVLVGLLWGAWHTPVFAVGPAYAAGFLVATLAMSVIMVVLVEAARGQQLLIAGSFHALINLGLLVLMAEEDGDLTAMFVTAGACAATALVALAVAGPSSRGARR